MKFSEKIVLLRKNKKLTQETLAKEVGVSRQSVYKWESGECYPDALKLVELKRILGISIDDLLDESFVVVKEEKQKRRRKKKETTENEAAEVVKEEVKEEPVEEVKEEKTEKKVGFFGRLFGRK